MKLAVNLSHHDALNLGPEAEQLGYATVFVPEGVHGDAASVLGLLAGRTRQIGLAAGVFELPARTPVLAAMTSATLHHLSGGRFRLGLGVSNAAISEGWFGVPFAAPLARMREYVAAVRLALRGEPVRQAGQHHPLPLPDSPGLAFQLPGGQPVPVPISLAAVGPRSLRLTGEIADGWFGVFCSPPRVADCVAALRRGRGGPLDGFDVAVSVPLVTGPAGYGPVRGYVSRFISLGAREHNVYFRLLADSGYAAAAERVVELVHAGDPAGAAEAVPQAFVEGMSLVGGVDELAARFKDFALAGVTTLAVSPLDPSPGQRLAALRVAAQALQRASFGANHRTDLTPAAAG